MDVFWFGERIGVRLRVLRDPFPPLHSHCSQVTVRTGLQAPSGEVLDSDVAKGVIPKKWILVRAFCPFWGISVNFSMTV